MCPAPRFHYAGQEGLEEITMRVGLAVVVATVGLVGATNLTHVPPMGWSSWNVCLHRICMLIDKT